jgi:peptidoglycan hydrolase-like protein with peptidoglycan-binding domain
MKARKNWAIVALGLAFAAAATVSTPSPAGAAYLRDLTVGSTGADVVELQTFLVSRGFLVMPAGVPMGYFGPITRDALARYQASVGISPAVGYFGSITRANLNLASGPGTAPLPSGYTYTRTLTIGSTGSDVIALQTFLVSRGHLVMPSGVPMGYFGPLTSAALARYQATVGLSAESGVFGPSTRAHLNAMANDDEGDDDEDEDDEDSDELQGGEGDIRDFEVLGNPNNEDIEEGDSGEVLGFEFEADGSDLRVERLEVVASTTGTGTDRPWDVIESARLMRDGDEVAEVSDLDDEDSWDEEDDDVYSFRFDRIDEIVDEGDSARFYVEFTAVGNIDSADDPTDIEVYIPDDGLRVVDAEGIQIYEGDEDEERTVTFGEAAAGDLELSIDESDNEDRTAFVDEDSETEGVEIMRFTIEANSSSATIDEIQVRLATSTATDTPIADVIKSLRLEVDGDEIATESVPGGTGTSTVTFEDLEDDFEIGEDEEVEVVILADIDEQEGNYGQGFSFYAAVFGSGIEAEDSSGDDITVSDDVYGGEIQLRVEGLAVELASTEVNRVLAADPGTSGSADAYSYVIRFEVTAEGDDVYIDKSVQNTDDPNVAGAGVAWATTSESDSGVTQTNSQTLSASGSSSGDTATAFKVSDGSTRTFTLRVVLQATADGSTAIELTGINWTTDSGDATPDEYYTFNLDDFETELQYMNYI